MAARLRSKVGVEHGDYYSGRVAIWLQQALRDAERGMPLNTTEGKRQEAAHAWGWTTATTAYPEVPTEGFLQVSLALREKYRPIFSNCP